MTFSGIGVFMRSVRSSVGLPLTPSWELNTHLLSPTFAHIIWVGVTIAKFTVQPLLSWLPLALREDQRLSSRETNAFNSASVRCVRSASDVAGVVTYLAHSSVRSIQCRMKRVVNTKHVLGLLNTPLHYTDSRRTYTCDYCLRGVLCGMLTTMPIYIFNNRKYDKYYSK